MLMDFGEFPRLFNSLLLTYLLVDSTVIIGSFLGFGEILVQQKAILNITCKSILFVHFRPSSVRRH